MNCQVAESLPELRRALGEWQGEGRRIGFVPTMGNLHAGHLALVGTAGKHCDRTVASIFVNPTQFGPGEDYESYPRTRKADLAELDQVGCDLVWMPSVETMYPLRDGFRMQVPAALADTLCGRSRSGHFDGVASVVLRLFNQVAPDLAVFGEKDFQQLLIIRQMVTDLSLPIDIIGVPTLREDDGLAMSSRNNYLDEEARRAAPELYRVLTETAAGLRAGKDFKTLRNHGLERLQVAGFEPEYMEWRAAEDLGEAAADRPSRVFAAAKLGMARLIDNVEV